MLNEVVDVSEFDFFEVTAHSKSLTPMSLVWYNTHGLTDFEANKLPRDFTDGTTILFLGEIKNKIGYGAFATKNKVYIEHLINFRETYEQ